MLFWPRVAIECCCSGEGPCGSIRVTVRDCSDDGLLEGADVTVTDAADVVIGAGESDAGGVYEVDIEAAGDYTVLVEVAGEEPATLEVEATCTTNDVEFSIGRVVSIVGAAGCGCALPGATITITRTVGGAWTGTATTDGGGNAELWVPLAAGDEYTYSIAAADYVTYNGTLGPIVHGGGGLYCGPPSPLAGSTLTSVSTKICMGGNPPICRATIPSSLTVTLGSSVATWGHLAGQTLTCNYSGIGAAGAYVFTYCARGFFVLDPESHPDFPEFYEISAGISVGIGHELSCSASSGSVQYYEFHAGEGGGTPDVTCAGGMPHGQASANRKSTRNQSSGTDVCPTAFTAGAGTSNAVVSA